MWDFLNSDSRDFEICSKQLSGIQINGCALYFFVFVLVVVLGLVLLVIINLCHVTGLYVPPENIRKPHEWDGIG